MTPSRFLALLVAGGTSIAAAEVLESSGYRFGRRARHVLYGPFRRGDPEEADPSAELALREVPDAKTGEWSGHRVWPGAIALLELLHRTRGASLIGMRVLELGCGLPLLAAGLAALGAEVCATDHPDALPFARSPLIPRRANDTSAGAQIEGLTDAARQRLRFRPLAWGARTRRDATQMSNQGEWGSHGTQSSDEVGELDDQYISKLCNFSGPVDLVVGADLVYDAYPWEPLKETVASILWQHRATAVLALQPRRFPMVSNLDGPPRVHSFLKGLAARAAQGDSAGRSGSLEVTIDRPGSAAKELLGKVAVESLLLATVRPPKARERGPASAGTAGNSGHQHALRYRQELLPVASDGGEQASADARETNHATRLAEL